jgi:hypothetical protein
LPLEFDPAVLLDRRLLNGDHMPLHLGKFSGRLFVPANEERRRPEDDHRSGGCHHRVLGSLAVLGTRECRRACGYRLCFLPELLARENRKVGTALKQSIQQGSWSPTDATEYMERFIAFASGTGAPF